MRSDSVSMGRLDPVLDAGDAPPVPRLTLPACMPAELRALVRAGENDSDACERLLAQVAREQSAIELAIGDGLAALARGDRLITLGASSLKDYTREVLGFGERKTQALVQLSRELETRPLLRAATLAGEIRLRAAQTVLPVARGDAEAGWVERARHETVRVLEAAVRAERNAVVDQEEEWQRFRVRLADDERAAVDEALDLAGRLLPGSSRAERLEAMAQEYLGGHPAEAEAGGARAGDVSVEGGVRGALGLDDGRRAHAAAGEEGAGGVSLLGGARAGGASVLGGTTGALRLDDARRAHTAAEEERAERESGIWAHLDVPRDVAAPLRRVDDSSTPFEIDRTLRALAARRDAWDDLLGTLAYIVRTTGVWRSLGFATFAQYCRERLGLSPRTVEQRIALERRLIASPALRAARAAGVSYERVHLLSRLPDREVATWVPRARALTCVELRAALDHRDDAQLRAARKFRARVPARMAELLQAAFEAVRAVEGCPLDDGRCLVRVARHFADTWRGHVKPPKTTSQKVRDRDACRCQVPGCSRRAVHAHHVIARSRGGSDDPSNLVSLCAFHHLVGVHEGYLRVSGTAPHGLTWELGPRHAPMDLRRFLGLEPAMLPLSRAA
jgi:hypothetical protein